MDSLFSAVVLRHGGRKEVAKLLKCSSEWVRRIEAGSTPGLELALRIEAELGISVKHWARSDSQSIR